MRLRRYMQLMCVRALRHRKHEDQAYLRAIIVTIRLPKITPENPLLILFLCRLRDRFMCAFNGPEALSTHTVPPKFWESQHC